MVQKHQENGGLGAFMSKLDEAEQRLQRAVSGLEDAARAASASASAGESASSTELDAAKARAAELENVNAAIAQRLDGAIAQIKEILDD
jgi:hypothetical protein